MPDHHHGVMLGAAAGVLFGVSDIAIKALTGADGVGGILTSPWLAVTVLASVIAFYASARGMQDGEAVPVIAATSTAANVSCILGGIIVFGDPMPSDTSASASRPSPSCSSSPPRWSPRRRSAPPRPTLTRSPAAFAAATAARGHPRRRSAASSPRSRPAARR